MAWGTAAFDRAAQEDKPVLLSVGYAACHWCHVMAHESFEDAETADLMNAHFINIKVDREERPDVDKIYMQALHSLGEQGGWPLTMFLTPSGQPFWGGTYFPKESRYGRPSFKHVLTEINRLWHTERHKITANGTALAGALRAQESASKSTGILSTDAVLSAGQALLGATDSVHGGLKGAPKFPQGPLFNFLWTVARRERSEPLAEAVVTTLRHICQGGIYDHLAGGIARYSTDHIWLVPHFEKMLYDNAQFVSLLSRVWLTTTEELFRTRIGETIDFVLKDLRVASGAFAASYDADSEGEEGRYYVWAKQEIDAALPAEQRTLFDTTYDVSEDGNWEGKTILNRLGSLSLLDRDSEALLANARASLLTLRQKRVPPGFDDKVLVDWNGLMIAALADAALVVGRKEWLQAADKAFTAVLDHLWVGDRLRHSWRDGKTRHEATAEGYANLIAAALALAAISPGSEHLEWAKRLTEAMALYHWDEARGAYCLSASDASMVIVRPAYGQDDATPNANAVMIENLAKLHHLTGEEHYLRRAESILSAFSSEAMANPFGYTTLLRSYSFLSDPIQIVTVSVNPRPFDDPLFRAAIKATGPDCVIQWIGTAQDLPPDHPAFDKSGSRRPALYLCRGNVCAAPSTNVADVREALALLGCR